MIAGADTKAVLERFVLADLLDESILGARPGDPSFALRVTLGALGEHLGEMQAFVFVCGLNYYFRSTAAEEEKLRMGIEVSRDYYRFVNEAGIETSVVREASPLLAQLMSSELSKVVLASVDHQGVFDSATHERVAGSDPSGTRIVAPESFLAKVSQNGMIRLKAKVRT